MSFRVLSISAFVSIDQASDEEGIVGAAIGPGNSWLPLIAADEDRLQQLMPVVKDIVTQTGITVKLIRFTHREEIMELTSLNTFLKEGKPDETAG